MRKHRVVPISCTILCLLGAMLTFSLPEPHHVHATEGVPVRTLHVSHATHPSDTIAGNMYYGISGSFNSIFAMRSSSGTLAWQYSAPGTFIDADSLHVVAGMLYFSSSNTLYALDASSGSVVWKSTTLLGLHLWPLPVSNGLVFAGVKDGVDTFDALTGKLLWHAPTNAFVSTGVVVNTVAYFVTNDGTAYALNAMKGTVLWHTSIGAASSVTTVTNGVVYAVVRSTTSSTSDGTVYTLSASTGTVLWHYTLPHTGSGGLFTLTVANSMIYVSENLGLSGFLFLALNASSGTLLWPQHAGTTFVWYSIGNNVVYTSDFTKVSAHNPHDGRALWSYQPGYSFEAFTVSNNIMYIAPDGTGNIVALNAATGHKLWSYQSHDSVLSWYIAATNDAFYVNGTNVALALNAKNGTLLWQYVNQYAANTAPILVQNVEYVASSNSDAYALDAQTGKLLWAY